MVARATRSSFSGLTRPRGACQASRWRLTASRSKPRRAALAAATYGRAVPNMACCRCQNIRGRPWRLAL
eukprot:7884565-Pyramimonas_sp.AAC.1